MKDLRDITRKKLGARIKELRKSAGLTQEELGEKATLNYKFIGELERGQVNVSVDSIVKIAEALGINIVDFFIMEKVPVQKVLVKEKSPLSKLSSQDLQHIKKTFKLLNKIFSKM